MSKSIKAYYFMQADRKLRYGDGRRVRKGTTHVFEGKTILCEQGLHASVSPLDALQYAPGAHVALVELSGTIVKGDDKCVATRRKYLAVADVSRELRIFAADCARRVLQREHKAGREPDAASWNAVDAAYLYADGLIDDADLNATYGAAYSSLDAARDASVNAAWSAASAAWSDADCAKVLETKCTSLLPTQSGFFFGSTEIDDYYYQDLEETIRIINSLNPNGDYYYQSSW